MASSRSREGSLPQSTYYAMLHGMRIPEVDTASRKDRIRRRQESTNSSVSNKLSRRRANSEPSEECIEDGKPQFKCILKVPNYPDELSTILGDTEKPYFGIFDEHSEGLDTNETHPTAEDRALFKQMRRRSSHSHSNEHDTLTRAQRTNMTIHFGQKYTMDAWYRSAYPAEYTRRDYMSVCCYCSDYSLSDLSAERHVLKCSRRFPPGREIYRNRTLSVWEVDGSHANLYCQNSCLLAKSFLSSKSLYRDVQPFFFYVLTEMDIDGPRFVGYFSKQKIHSYFKPNGPIQCVSCIIALPFTQSSGYGQFMIDFSYLLTKTQETTGGPETPLSASGERAFRRYWKRAVSEMINEQLTRNSSFSVSSLSKLTGITSNHVILALEDLGWSKVSGDGKPQLAINREELHALCAQWKKYDSLALRPECLIWTPLFN